MRHHQCSQCSCMGKRVHIPRITRWGNARLTVVKKKIQLSGATTKRTPLADGGSGMELQHDHPGHLKGESNASSPKQASIKGSATSTHVKSERGEQSIITQGGLQTGESKASSPSQPKALLHGYSRGEQSIITQYRCLHGESKASSPNTHSHRKYSVQTHELSLQCSNPSVFVLNDGPSTLKR